MLNIELLKNTSFQCDFSFISKVNQLLRQYSCLVIDFIGASRETRTPDSLITNQLSLGYLQ